MIGKQKLSNVVWGLEFGGSAVRLIRVTRVDPDRDPRGEQSPLRARYRADGFVEAPLEDRWASAPDLSAAAVSLRTEKLSEPLAACMPDELTLYRALSLPQADAAAVEKMVQRQLEAFVPAGEDDLFVWGWQSAGDPLQAGSQRALLCAARKDLAEQLTGACKSLADDSAVVVPSAMALAKAHAELFPPEEGTVALLDVAARSSTVVIVRAGSVLACGVIDQGGDHWTDLIAEQLAVSPEEAETRKLEHLAGKTPHDGQALPGCLQRGLGQWSQQLREVYQACLEGPPRSDRPVRCVIFGRAGRTPGLPEIVSQTLGLPAQRVAEPAALSLSGQVPFERAAVAVGAALCRLTEEPEAGGQATINLAVGRKAKVPTLRKFSWRWAAVAAWLVAAVGGLYGLDRYEAAWLKSAAGRIRGSAAGQGGLERQLEIARYLEQSGAPALAILDELCALAPESLILTSWGYNHSGEVTVAGTVSSEKDFHSFLAKLRDSRMLSDLEPRRQKKESGKFQFELVVKAGPGMGPAPPPASTKPSAPAPATQPAAAAPPKAATAPGGASRVTVRPGAGK